MNPWIDADTELPSANEIVEVEVTFASGSMQLRGYRLPSRTGVESLWLNALTHEPFPDGWRVSRWKKAEGQMAEHSAASGADNAHHRV